MLSGETVLSGEVLVSGDLLVPAGSTLTLAPGTMLRIRKAENTKIDPEYLSSATEILVRGTLIAAGTAQAPILLIPEQPVAAGEIGWAGIILDHASAGMLRYVRIEQAEQGILCIAAQPLIEANRISGCRYGIVAQARSAPRILSNRIERGEGGIFVWDGSNPYLKYNQIVGNVEEGIFVDATSRPWLDRNEVSTNAIGLALWPRDLPYDPSGIRDNREDVRLLGGQP